MSKIHMFAVLLLTAIAVQPVVAQPVTNDKPEAQEVPQFKILSTRFVTEAKGMFESSWSTENIQRTGLLVAVEASFGSKSFEVKPASFFVKYSLGDGGHFDEECIGLASSIEPKSGEWVLVGSGMTGFIILPRTEQGNASFALLFVVSKKIHGEMSLIYRHPAAVAKTVVKR